METPGSFRQADAVFDAALDLAPEGRDAFVARACAGDPALHSQVRRLLCAHDQTEGFLAQSAMDIAAPMLDEASRMAGALPPDELPATIGPYRILRLLGRGGMGEVFLAERDEASGSPVALKILRSGEAVSGSALRRFLAERQILVGLDHPNVARLLDAGVTSGGAPYFVMPHCPGGSLADRLAQGALPVAEALRIATGLAMALGAAHGLGIVHRDIKPANVLFGPNDEVLLTDFGIAKLVNQDSTQSGHLIGTPAYLAPEQIRGESADHRADLWGLGVTLYQMLTGRRAFEGESHATVLHAVLDSELAPPAPGTVPAVLGELLRHLLQKDPDARPTSAGVVAGALAAISTDPSAPYSLAAVAALPPSRRKSIRVTALGALAFAVIGIAAWRLSTRGAPAVAGDRTGSTVAVAILSNRTSDTALEPLGIMAAEWISRGMTRVPPVTVLDLNALYTRGRTASGEPVDPMTLARLSNSAYVVGGAYYRAGTDSLRFAAEVIDASSGRIVRTVQPIVGSVADPIPAIDELGNRLASAIQSILDPRSAYIDAHTQSPPRYEAFREFVIGQEAFWNVEYTKALEHTLRAARQDTTFAMAAVFATIVAVNVSRCDLVDSITASFGEDLATLNEFERNTLGMSRVRCQRNWPEGVRLQQRRLELQPRSVIVQRTAASTLLEDKSPSAAAAMFRRMDLTRDLVWLLPRGRENFLAAMSSVLHMAGDFAGEHGLADEIAKAGGSPLRVAFLRGRAAAGRGDTAAARQVLDALPPDQPAEAGPLAVADDQLLETWIPSPGFVRLAVAAELAAHGHDSHARRVASEAVDLIRRDVPAGQQSPTDRYIVGSSLFLAGQYAEAQQVFEALASDHPAHIRIRGMLGAAAARTGDRKVREAARHWLGGLTNVVPPGLPPYQLAAIAAHAGETDVALDLVESLPYGAHPHSYVDFHVDPLLAPLRGNPRFERFLKPR